jgi:hypothetical protein
MNITKLVAAPIAAAAAAGALLLVGVGTAHAGTTYACPTQFNGGDFRYSGAVTEETTCGFAESVRYSYDAQPTRGVPTTVVAHSPRTDNEYPMYCTPGTVVSNGQRVDAVRCSGGNNAVVDLW